MSMKDFELNIKDWSNYDFSDEQIKEFKSCITQVYKILKNVFDRKRKNRPYNSVQAYKFKRQQRFSRPDDFYYFQHDNVEIHIGLRRGYYSVAVTGFKSTKFFDFLQTLSATEKNFSCGFDYYGKFPPDKFFDVVILFNNIVKNYLDGKFLEQSLSLSRMRKDVNELKDLFKD